MTTTKAKNKNKKDQEEYVAHLIVQMQNYFEGLQAANRGPGAPVEPSPEVQDLIAAYEERRLKLEGPNFRSMKDIPGSLARSLADVHKRVDVLIEFGWPKERLLGYHGTQS